MLNLSTLEKNKLVAEALQRFHDLSARERLMIIGAAAVGIFLLSYQIVESIVPHFQKQTQRLELLAKNAKTLPALLKRYQDLSKQQRKIETQFDSGDKAVDIPSYIEGLMKIPDIEINKLAPRDFGGKFEQTQFNIAFYSSDLEQVTSFLEKIIKGKQPLLVTKVGIINSRSSRLRVTFEVSSIRQKA